MQNTQHNTDRDRSCAASTLTRCVLSALNDLNMVPNDPTRHGIASTRDLVSWFCQTAANEAHA